MVLSPQQSGSNESDGSVGIKSPDADRFKALQEAFEMGQADQKYPNLPPKVTRLPWGVLRYVVEKVLTKANIEKGVNEPIDGEQILENLKKLLESSKLELINSYICYHKDLGEFKREDFEAILVQNFQRAAYLYGDVVGKAFDDYLAQQGLLGDKRNFSQQAALNDNSTTDELAAKVQGGVTKIIESSSTLPTIEYDDRDSDVPQSSEAPSALVGSKALIPQMDSFKRVDRVYEPSLKTPISVKPEPEIIAERVIIQPVIIQDPATPVSSNRPIRPQDLRDIALSRGARSVEAPKSDTKADDIPESDAGTGEPANDRPSVVFSLRNLIETSPYSGRADSMSGPISVKPTSDRGRNLVKPKESLLPRERVDACMKDILAAFAHDDGEFGGLSLAKTLDCEIGFVENLSKTFYGKFPEGSNVNTIHLQEALHEVFTLINHEIGRFCEERAVAFSQFQDPKVIIAYNLLERFYTASEKILTAISVQHFFSQTLDILTHRTLLAELKALNDKKTPLDESHVAKETKNLADLQGLNEDLDQMSAKNRAKKNQQRRKNRAITVGTAFAALAAVFGVDAYVSRPGQLNPTLDETIEVDILEYSFTDTTIVSTHAEKEKEALTEGFAHMKQGVLPLGKGGISRQLIAYSLQQAHRETDPVKRMEYLEAVQDFWNKIQRGSGVNEQFATRRVIGGGKYPDKYPKAKVLSYPTSDELASLSEYDREAFKAFEAYRADIESYGLVESGELINMHDVPYGAHLRTWDPEKGYMPTVVELAKLVGREGDFKFSPAREVNLQYEEGDKTTKDGSKHGFLDLPHDTFPTRVETAEATITTTAANVEDILSDIEELGEDDYAVLIEEDGMEDDVVIAENGEPVEAVATIAKAADMDDDVISVELESEDSLDKRVAEIKKDRAAALYENGEICLPGKVGQLLDLKLALKAVATGFAINCNGDEDKEGAVTNYIERRGAQIFEICQPLSSGDVYAKLKPAALEVLQSLVG